MLLIGIDYSISSPAMSMMYVNDIKENEFAIKNIQIRCLTEFKTKKPPFELPVFNDIKAILYPPYFIKHNNYEYKSYIDRWKYIGKYFESEIMSCYWHNQNKYHKYIPIYVAIEGYAYTYKSLMVNIAENTAILKYMLKEYGDMIKFKIYQPTSVKKFLTKNGNANKEKVYDFICNKLGIDLYEYLKIPMYLKNGEKNEVPMYDISDSLAILYMLYCEMKVLNDVKVSDFEYDYLTKVIGKYSIISEGFV